MRTGTKWYMGSISLVGMVLGLLSAWDFLGQQAGLWTAEHISTLVLLVVLCWACSCLPLYISEHLTVDLSFLSILASVLLLGPQAAVIINLVTYPFAVVPTPEGKTFYHALNTPPLKTLTNMANHNLSYLLAGLVYYAAGGIPGDLSLPGVLLPALLFIIVSMLVNVVIIVGYFALEQSARFCPTIIQMLWGLMPSIALSAPISFFLAMLLQYNSGVWLALLFVLPLLLARYSFKLYLDVRQHQTHMIKAMMVILETKDTYTEGHSVRVEQYAALIARELKLSPERIKTLRLAAIFHDIGKIGVPDIILQKPGALDPSERAIIQQHAEAGARILEHMPGYERIIPLVLHHHEFFDGRGYPEGTREGAISLDTYVLSAADAYDAITSDRPYRKGRSVPEAAAILRQEAGRQFHPEVALAAARMAEAGLLNCTDAEA